MKKSLFFTILLITTIITVSAKQDFSSSLRTCSSYSESGSVTTEGMDVSSTKQIVGWEDNKCVYKETINFAGINSTVTCKLTKPQIDELVSVMNAYSLVQQYSNESVDTSTLSGVQNNPVVKVWSKFLQDSSTCTMTGIK